MNCIFIRFRKLHILLFCFGAFGLVQDNMVLEKIKINDKKKYYS
mgnify:CR=1 FL=1